jgi:hypothetical protein
MRTRATASPHSAITNTNGIGALGWVSANNPPRNLETVLNAACMAIGHAYTYAIAKKMTNASSTSVLPQSA